MIRINFLKIKIFVKSVWNGVAGVSLEIFLAYLFIFVGFLVCLLWWSIYK